MLFPLNPQTPRSKIFTALNEELLHFLEAAIDANEFSLALFTDIVGQACWDNTNTRDKFNALWAQLHLLTEHERRRLYNRIRSSQDVRGYFSNRTLEFPEISQTELNKKLAELTLHLFSNTKKLAGIRDACEGETIQHHFNNYRQMNGNLCQVCGTEILAQKRSGILDEDQWSAPYDHLLSKDKYPAYAIHPDNLLPICHTCNSKAKLAKQLLIKKQHDGTEVRRLGFYPYEESCRDLVKVELHGGVASLQLKVIWDTPDVDTAEKIIAWDEVYQVKQRVEGDQVDFISWIDGDCQAIDFDDFNQQLQRRANQPNEQIIRSECYKFWRFKLYRWIAYQGDDFKNQLWAMIEQRRSDYDSRFIYGV